MISKELFLKESKAYKSQDLYDEYEKLCNFSYTLRDHFQDVCFKFLDDIRIINCPASTGKLNSKNRYLHHGFFGGLITHTLQVVNGAVSLARTHGSIEIDFNVLVSGAILHDWGKLFVYDKWEIEGGFGITNNAIFEGHLSRSYSEFMIASSNWNIDQQRERLEISHIILSHHGKKEFGSPIECKTPEAHCVHLADVYSSRAMIGGDGVEKL